VRVNSASFLILETFQFPLNENRYQPIATLQESITASYPILFRFSIEAEDEEPLPWPQNGGVA